VVEDVHFEMLRMACLAADRAESCRVQVEAEGQTVPGAAGQATAHPLLGVRPFGVHPRGKLRLTGAGFSPGVAAGSIPAAAALPSPRSSYLTYCCVTALAGDTQSSIAAIVGIFFIMPHSILSKSPKALS
jgi:hypothetical protein